MTVNLNPWAKEFFPPSQYSFAYPLLPLPPSPPSFLPPPTVNTPTPISYNIFSPLQLQMNYMPPISPPSFPVMGCPIPFPPVNTHFPCEIIIDPLLNISVCPSQQGLMASPQPQPQPQPQPCAGAHSRSLLLTCVPPQLTEEDLRRNLRTWGPIRALHLQKKYEGVVIVDYFDLRHANEALADIQQGRQFIGRGWGMKGGKSICAEYARPTAQNQGTLVVFNLDATMSPHCIRSYFQRYGALKEVRESPLNRQVKFVEFFDVRDACRALEALDETVIGSKPVKILFSHLGSRALRGASTSYNRPPRQQHIYNFKWINGKQACSYQAGVTNILRDQTNMATSIEGWAADSIPNGETGSFPEITGESFTQFAFDEDEALSNSAQARTTIMIKNIPNKYDLDMILKVLDSHCMQCNEQITGADESFSEYDFVYLPIDFKYVNILDDYFPLTFLLNYWAIKAGN
ncbi:protein terminal ear1 homolog [Cryptomeria japonica]|uniref:protein terminal ear1 homolog n=1 Tax=Cryptomeria japonica TaxID=3369 RepID=UPI0027DA35B6|nr:protein terminal ear1 homolog [Cryptomeria japonica]